MNDTVNIGNTSNLYNCNNSSGNYSKYGSFSGNELNKRGSGASFSCNLDE